MAKKKKRDGQEFFPLKKGRILDKVLTIDPGMWRTGLAFWPSLANDKSAWHPEKTKMFDVISDAFNSKNHPGRTDIAQTALGYGLKPFSPKP